ncbi:hypothetical protein [Noviherbaspirillum malthae]|jgi:hypothetical protein|uniref:hypothetical protein n=1 Tax=Noviherbaspirillum malthae TaxID=1260987 RepID=UPI00188E412B|nr:hypothetical protein [Noviherbaspirillum malthae]
MSIYHFEYNKRGLKGSSAVNASSETQAKETLLADLWELGYVMAPEHLILIETEPGSASVAYY